MSLSCALENIPVEVLVLIFNYLDHPAQKVFRCLSKHLCAFAEPQLFSTVALDLDRGGYSGLCAISEHTRLREHVTTLHLERRVGLADFGDFETWENSTIFAYKAPDGFEVLDSPQLRPGSLSLETWSMLSRDERLILYEDYEEERIQMETDAEELAAAMCTLFGSGYPFSAPAATPSSRLADAQSLLKKLYRAIAALPNLKSLQHHPAYLDEDNWRTHWRELRFHPDAIILHCAADGDVEIDAVQHFLVLHAIASSSGPMRRLQAVELFTGGIGFWDSMTLRHLLNWAELEDLDSEDLILRNWLAAEQPSVTLRRQEEMTRQLCTVESAFTRVTALDWTICNEDALPTACRFLGRVLWKCEDLQQARLAIRHGAPFVEEYIYHKFGSLAVVPVDETIRMLESASTELFGPWSTSPRLGTLTTLELSMATTEAELWGFLKKTTRLRHVTLRRVTILPGNGCWNEMLRKMSEGLTLTSVKLVGLEDVWNERPRLVLDPEASLWVERDEGTHWYRTYESAIVEYVLRRQSRFPILSASEFFERGCKMGVSL